MAKNRNEIEASQWKSYKAAEKYLLAYLAQTTEVDYNVVNTQVHGFTVLGLAIEYCRSDVVKRLLERGANVNALSTREGLGPFHHFNRPKPKKPEETPEETPKETPEETLEETLEETPEETPEETLKEAPKEANEDLDVRSKMIKCLLDCGGDINLRATNGRTPLHYAINSASLTEFFLTNGADANVGDYSKKTPLHLACESEESDLEVIRKLALKTDLERAVDIFGNTPLHYACQNRKLNIEVVDLVQSAKARNFRNNKGETPLLCLFRSRPDPRTDSRDQHFSACTLLLDNKADPNIADRNGDTPLHLACGWGELAETEVRFLLENGANPKIANKRMELPMQIICCSERPCANILKLLLEHGAEKYVNVQNRESVLHLASSNSNCRQDFIFEIIHRWQSDKTSDYSNDFINDKNTFGETALFIAVKSNHIEAIKVLLQKNAKILETDNKGDTVLHVCAKSKENYEVMEMILDNYKIDDKRLDVEITNNDLSTPLHIASFYGHCEVAILLLEYGAKPNHLKNRLSRTPLQVAADNKRTELVQIFLDHLVCSKTKEKQNNEEQNMEQQDMEEQNKKAHKIFDNIKRETEIACQTGCIDYVIMRLGDERKLEGRTVNEYLLQNSEDCLLKIALDSNQKEIVNAILDCKLWETALDHSWGTLEALRVTPMRLLIEKYPDIARKVFDKCISSNGTNELKFRFKFIDDTYTDHTNYVKPSMREPDTEAGQAGNLHGTSRKSSKILAPNATNETTKLLTEDEIKHVNEIAKPTNSISTSHKSSIAKNSFTEYCKRLFTNKSTESSTQAGSQHQAGHVELTNRRTHEQSIQTSSTPSSAGSQAVPDQTKRDTAQPETSIEASQKRGSKLKSRTQKDNHPLQLMIKQQINKKTKQDEENLLDHPLVRTLVSHKWSYFRFIYYLWAFLYLFFVLFLTCYISSTPAPFYERNQTLWQLEGLCVYEKEAELISPTTTWTFILRYSLFSFATILLIKECREFIIKLVGCWTSFKWKSLKEIQIDLIEILLYSTTILLTIPVPISKCSEWTGPINMWQRTSGILAVSFAWLNLALFSRKTKLFGIQIIAFTKVLKTFIRHLPILIIFLMGFASAFFALLWNIPQFSSFFRTIGRMTILIQAEYSTFDRLLGIEESAQPAVIPPLFTQLGIAIFLLFVATMTLVLMNMLQGLAVDDIANVLKEAELRKLAMHTELVLDFETHFRKCSMLEKYLLRKHYFEKEKTINTLYSKNMWRWFSQMRSSFPVIPVQDKEVIARARVVAQAQAKALANL